MKGPVFPCRYDPKNSAYELIRARLRLAEQKELRVSFSSRVGSHGSLVGPDERGPSKFWPNLPAVEIETRNAHELFGVVGNELRCQ